MKNLKSKLFVAGGICAACWPLIHKIADKVGHMFGFCLGG